MFATKQSDLLVIIESEKKVKEGFSITLQRKKETGETYRVGNHVIAVTKFVTINKVSKIKSWNLVQRWLEDNIYKDECYIRNLTHNHIDFHLISTSYDRFR